MQIKTIGCIAIGLGLGWIAFTEPKTKEKWTLIGLCPARNLSIKKEDI